MPAWNRPARRALHAGIDIGVVPHVERAGCARTDGNADESDDGERGMRLLRCQHHADERREHDERHHAGLHQSDEVADASAHALCGAQSARLIADLSHFEPRPRGARDSPPAVSKTRLRHDDGGVRGGVKRQGKAEVEKDVGTANATPWGPPTPSPSPQGGGERQRLAHAPASRSQISSRAHAREWRS